MILILFLIFSIYYALIISFIIGFENLKKNKIQAIPPKNSFSIVVPFRNESQNLKPLLNSIKKLKYPTNLFEILLINDESSDNFKTIITSFKKENPCLNIRLLNTIRKSNSPKKDAISMAINNATFNWMVTTDADCTVPVKWLENFNQLIEEKKLLFIAAPVKFNSESSFLFHFQNLNFISLMGATIGSFGIEKPILCNGANLCFSKELFKELNGFSDNDSIASGDDIFLLEKASRFYPKQTGFVKSKGATVTTKSSPNLRSFINQQIRWASKTPNYTNNFSKFVGASIFITNLTTFFLYFYSFKNYYFLNVFILFFSFKMLVDFVLIYKTALFLKATNSLKYYVIISILYPFFIVYISIISPFKNYEWKGRKFKK